MVSLLGAADVFSIACSYSYSHLDSLACGVIFRRVEESPRMTSTGTQTSQIDSMSKELVERPTRSRIMIRGENDCVSNISKFRRIQLICASLGNLSVQERKKPIPWITAFILSKCDSLFVYSGPVINKAQL